MNRSERTLAFGGIVAALNVVPVSPTVQLVTDATESNETPLPAEFSPVTLLVPTSGNNLVGEDAAEPELEPIERVVGKAFAYIQRVAAALPYSREDDELISNLMAEKTNDLEMRPIRRVVDDEG